MSFLFVYPNVDKSKTPQMGLLALGSYLMEHGVDVSICDLTFTDSRRYIDEIQSAIDRTSPELIGFSIRTLEFRIARELLKAIRNSNPKLPIVAGGPHVTFKPEDCAPYIDYGVMGNVVKRRVWNFIQSWLMADGRL